jgi:hypothetical protein
MKKIAIGTFVFVVALTMTFGVALALWVDDEKTIKLSGPHWQFNISGHPMNNKDYIDGALKNDNSNGRSIKVPLKNVNKPGYATLDCDYDGTSFTDDMAVTLGMPNVEIGKAKIYFTPGDTFSILDRDATDGRAEIVIPTTLEANPIADSGLCVACDEILDPTEKSACLERYCEGQEVVAVDVWVRALGKPNTCMGIYGWAHDLVQGLYFWSGRIDINRKRGKSAWVDVSKIFDVNWCEVETDCAPYPCSPSCAEGTEFEISVFNNVFGEYFWDILNDGSRLVQVRLYPVTNTP